MTRFAKPLLWSSATLVVLFGLFLSVFFVDAVFLTPTRNFNNNFFIPAQEGDLEAMKLMERWHREGFTRGAVVIPKDEKQADYWKRRIEEAERNHKS